MAEGNAGDGDKNLLAEENNIHEETPLAKENIPDVNVGSTIGGSSATKDAYVTITFSYPKEETNDKEGFAGGKCTC